MGQRVTGTDTWPTWPTQICWPISIWPMTHWRWLIHCQPCSTVRPATLKTRSLAADVAGMQIQTVWYDTDFIENLYKTDGNLHVKYIPISSHSHTQATAPLTFNWRPLNELIVVGVIIIIIPVPAKKAFAFPFLRESHGTHGNSRLLLTSTHCVVIKWLRELAICELKQMFADSRLHIIHPTHN